MAEGFPYALTFLGLFLIALIRGQATYWIARLVTSQTLRLTATQRQGWVQRVRSWLLSDSLDRGRAAIARWGVVAVALCYLTVGIQTAVMAAAGVLRIRWAAFTAAQAVGSLAWATIYSTIGFAAWGAVASLAVTSHPVLLLLAVLGVALLFLAWRMVRARRTAARQTV